MRDDALRVVAPVDDDRDDVELAVEHHHQVGEEAVAQPRQHAGAEGEQRLGEGEAVRQVERADLGEDLPPFGERETAGEIGDESLFQPVLRLVDVADRLRAEIDDVEALIGPADEKALALELARGLADRPAADAEALRHLRLVEPRAGLEIAARDGAHDALSHRARQRNDPERLGARHAHRPVSRPE